MEQVRIASLAVDPRSGQPVLILKPLSDEPGGAGRLLPIWIGAPEATAILLALEEATPPRPLTHDLLRSALDTFGARIERVDITHVDSGTFYAELVLAVGDGTITLDARPSDSVALAIRAGAPIFVAEAVLDEASVPDEAGGIDEEQELAAFREFLDAVDPEDFQS